MGSPITSDMRVVDQMLINKQPDKDWEASPPWAPPFDDPAKIETYNKLPRYVQDNIARLNVQGEDARWNIVLETYKQYLTQKNGYSPHTPEGTPPPLSQHTPEGTPPSRGGGAIIFNDPLLDREFNKLGGSQQSKILQLEGGKRISVMHEIIRRSQMGGQNLATNGNGDPSLNKAFNALPVHNQMVALQGGYNSMAKEFGGLAKHVPEVTTTINRPVPMSVQLAGKFPLLAVEQKGGNKNTSETKTSNDEISSSSSSSDSNSGGSIKKIII
jgi:hypothetical protein